MAQTRVKSAMSDLNIEYLQLVTKHQSAIYGYIRSLAPGVEIDDVLQETNIVLWEKSASFEQGTSFKAFAFRVAHLKTLEALRKQRRDHWMAFDTDLLEAIAAQITDENEDSSRQNALRECLAALEEHDRQLIHARYTESRTVRSIAGSTGRSEGSLQQLFFRIRNALRTCIEQKIIREGGRG